MYDDVQTPLELSVLARIINTTNEKGQVSASQVILGRTELVKDVANRYQQILRKYGINIVFKQGGMSFEKA
jgi:3-deoxy-D-manno-octulosonic acid (KDO) 8-phosphate synthase